MAAVKIRKSAKAPKVDPLDELETPRGFEYIDGELVERNVGTDASRVGSRIVGELYAHCKATNAGEALQGDTAFECFARPKRHVRKPDVAFVLAARAATVGDGPGDYPIRPDLVVEVMSHREPGMRTNAKVQDWLSVGVPLIWVIDPDNRIARVYVAGRVGEIGEDAELPVGKVLPGFRLVLRDVLPKSRKGRS